MIVPDKDKGIIRFIFSEANFCLGSNPFPEKKDEKIFFSSGMMMVRSIVRGDCPCIFQPLSSETVVSSVSPLYFALQNTGEKCTMYPYTETETPLSILSPCVSVREYRGSVRRTRGLKKHCQKNSL